MFCDVEKENANKTCVDCGQGYKVKREAIPPILKIDICLSCLFKRVLKEEAIWGYKRKEY